MGNLHHAAKHGDVFHESIRFEASQQWLCKQPFLGKANSEKSLEETRLEPKSCVLAKWWWLCSRSRTAWRRITVVSHVIHIFILSYTPPWSIPLYNNLLDTNWEKHSWRATRKKRVLYSLAGLTWLTSWCIGHPAKKRLKTCQLSSGCSIFGQMQNTIR